MNIKQFTDQSAGRVVQTERGYQAFVPNPLPPAFSWTPSAVALLSRADRALGELAGIGRALPNPHLLILPFARREAVLSSRIEGTQASLSDLFAYEAAPNPDAAGDVREVFNYIRALEYGLARLDDLPLSLRLIREIHEQLMHGVRGEHSTPGEFRRSQNWIGPSGCLLNDATYVPPPVEEMRACLGDFEQFLYTRSDIPPLVQLALLHYQFEAIHPFIDGNGRVGRLVIIMLLCLWDLLPQPLLYLSAYFEANRQTYYDLLLSVTHRGTWEEWIRFFLEGVESQARDAISRSHRIQDLRRGYRMRFQTTQSSARLLQVVDLLFGAPILSVKQVKDALNVSFPSANRYIKQLQDAGIIREITGQTRNRLYKAEEILNVIDGPINS
ncbi:Fic family protein [Candidatus Bipolaricaulota bacterium]|nr:Fic family protein [Candidatus Bipolaricaulota bacterium]